MKDSVTYKIILAVGRFGPVLINCNDILKELANDICGDRLDELVDNVDELPTEIGVYTGLLTLEHTFLEYDNHWDLTSITVHGCMCLNKLEL
jgi:hypothetical protein